MTVLLIKQYNKKKKKMLPGCTSLCPKVSSVELTTMNSNRKDLLLALFSRFLSAGGWLTVFPVGGLLVVPVPRNMLADLFCLVYMVRISSSSLSLKNDSKEITFLHSGVYLYFLYFVT